MSGGWNEYVALLDEAAGLAELEAKEIAAADSDYNTEARRLQNDLALAERDFKALKERNTRLQVGVRDLVRKLGVTIPPSSDLQRLAKSQLSDSMKSAEYDLEQIRKSLEYTNTQRQVIAKAPVPPPPPVPDSSPPQGTGDKAKKRFPVFAIAAGAGLGVTLIVILVVLWL